MNTPQQPHSRSNPNRRRTQAPKSNMSEWAEVLFFYLLPFLLFNGILFVLATAKPQITIKVANTKDYKTTQASVTIQSLFPIKEFSSAQEGTPLVLTETKKGQYTADIVRNGVIEIYAKGLNGMAVTKYEHVNILDDVAPLVGESYSIQDGILSLTLEDSQSGVDYQSVFAIAPSGMTLLPLSSDRQTGTFTFPMEEEFLVIYANDLAGNGMQATFNTHVETLAPDAVPTTQYSDSGEGALSANEAAASPQTETSLPQAVPQTSQTEANLPQAAQTATPEPPQTQTQEPPTEEEIMIHIRTH